MRLNVYTIYDTAAGAYMRPFYAQSDAQAIRVFGDLSVAADHDVGRHPEDYSLFRVATFDDNTGVFHPEDRECLITGLEAVSRSRNVSPDTLEMFDAKISNDA